MPCSGRPSRRVGSFTRQTVLARPRDQRVGLARAVRDEGQERRLLGRYESTRRRRTERRTRLVEAQSAQQLAPEVAVFAGDSSLFHGPTVGRKAAPYRARQA